MPQAVPSKFLNARIRNCWLKPMPRPQQSLKACVDEHKSLRLRTPEKPLKSIEGDAIEANVPHFAVFA
jgi:hypothetical protein